MALVEKYCDEPINILLVGHNPSQASWDSGHYYSNPSNLFWRLMRESELIPEHFLGVCDDQMVTELSFGFTDVIRVPGSDASKINRMDFIEQRDEFYNRISVHASRIKSYPRVIAFIGKRQFAQLFDPPLKSTKFGIQSKVPKSLPIESEIWVLPSSSGRAAMKWTDRLKPYQKLSKRMQNAFPVSNIE